MTDDSIYIGGRQPESSGDETRVGDASTVGESQSFAAHPSIFHALAVTDERDFAGEALTFLLRDLAKQGSEGEALAQRLLELHPDAKRLSGLTPRNPTFKDLLFDELAAIETRTMGVVVDARLLQREPLAYWLRRRELSRHAEISRVCARLPPVFSILAKSPDHHILNGCFELSARMIAGTLSAKPDLDPRHFLRPLTRDTQRRVVELLDAGRDNAPQTLYVPQHDSGLADVWLAGIERISLDPARGPRRVGELLGRMLLATMLERVEPVLVKAAIDCAVTVIFHKLLESDVFEIDFEGPNGFVIEDLVTGVFLSNGS